MPLHVDRQNLPLLRLEYLGDYTDDELIRFLQEISAVLRTTSGRKTCLIDLRKATAGTARQRKLQAGWIGDNEEALAKDFAAAAIVTSSALIRGTVTAVFWIRPLPLPTNIVATVAQAEAWLAPFLARGKA
jgi:hypothetical protein